MRLGCILGIVLTIGPRLALLFIWLFTERVSLAFESIIWPLLGFIFLPFTTFAYVLVWNPLEGMSGLAWLAVVIALLIDLAIYAGIGYGNRRTPSSSS
jgi:hypothetical protein